MVSYDLDDALSGRKRSVCNKFLPGRAAVDQFTVEDIKGIFLLGNKDTGSPGLINIHRQGIRPSAGPFEERILAEVAGTDKNVIVRPQLRRIVRIYVDLSVFERIDIVLPGIVVELLEHLIDLGRILRC